MENLIRYLESITIKLAPASTEPQTVDLRFMKIAFKHENPVPEEIAEFRKTLVELTEKNQKGFFHDMNPLDGELHDYIEIGSWIGDQGFALQYMGALSLVGLGDIKTVNGSVEFTADVEKVKAAQESLERPRQLYTGNHPTNEGRA